MRVLVASTGGAGHFSPLVPVLDALARRGDEVLVVVPPELEATVESSGHELRIGEGPPEDELADLWRRAATVSPDEGAVLVNREIFGRLCTAAMLPALERACEEWRPDLVLHEPSEYASAVAAERLGIPHAQVAISLAEVEARSLERAAPALERYRHNVADRLLASPYLSRFPDSLDPSPFPATRRFGEVSGGSGAPLPDWWGGSEAPLVYATFGSVAGQWPIGAAAYRTTLDLGKGLRARVLLTVGHATEVAALGPIPKNVHIEAWVPQADVLSHAALVVCHGGSGTTLGALAAGVPLVLVPLFADQPVNAARVSAAGAGVVVELKDASRLRAAIETVLADGRYRRAAGRIAGEMRALPAVDEVLAALEIDLTQPKHDIP